MLAEQARQDLIAHDLANASTAGYKPDRVSSKSFGELFTASKAYKQKGELGTVDAELKTLFQTTAGWAPETLRTGRVVDFATRPIQVTDLIPQTTTSQAAVVASCLALMDAGVPLAAPVSGIAMGLMIQGDQVVILSDIADAEDFAGDMDFKTAGTAKGITALQPEGETLI